ncbi:hypothetical protein KM043_005981 [Ampulex compressa]|nr:hypothetical protein KM043_005981 [Ampulex compressa]
MGDGGGIEDDNEDGKGVGGEYEVSLLATSVDKGRCNTLHINFVRLGPVDFHDKRGGGRREETVESRRFHGEPNEGARAGTARQTAIDRLGSAIVEKAAKASGEKGAFCWSNERVGLSMEKSQIPRLGLFANKPLRWFESGRERETERVSR